MMVVSASVQSQIQRSLNGNCSERTRVPDLKPLE